MVAVAVDSSVSTVTPANKAEQHHLVMLLFISDNKSPLVFSFLFVNRALEAFV